MPNTLPPPGGPPLKPLLVLVEELPVIAAVTLADELPEMPDAVPVEPPFALRLRFFVLVKEFPSLSFHVMTRGTDERSLAVKVISKLEKSSAASEPIAYCA
jgi:hypothetical protein